jgi:hypothetical protein
VAARSEVLEHLSWRSSVRDFEMRLNRYIPYSFVRVVLRVVLNKLLLPDCLHKFVELADLLVCGRVSLGVGKCASFLKIVTRGARDVPGRGGGRGDANRSSSQSSPYRFYPPSRYLLRYAARNSAIP